MSKYYCSEMCNRVAYDAIQVLGGSGYMKDYAAERYRPRRPHHHDLRRHQPVAGGGGRARRHLRLAGHLGRAAREEDLRRSAVGRAEAEARRGPAAAWSRPCSSSSRRALRISTFPAGGWSIRPSTIIIGHLLLAQGAKNERKKRVARRFIDRELPVLRMNCEQILAADMAAMEEYALLAGPVPAAG